ncbi:polysaccharide biosynthesis/export family protein [uncultured Duncaniella sp.]|uniref:polysaccharide biosynthesis/export family protein n=1 Tax=uncultured Duncaniella sp. TaxID=2768039 RepID=UPI002629117D|nr:polysaccharide biosynthesis/export family protein [uncultured Duncaniella sp.]
MKTKSLFLSVIVAGLFASCNSSKTVLPYFTDISTIKEGSFPAENYMPEIKPDDELFISVTSINPEATAVYNVPTLNPATREMFGNTITPTPQTYVVSSTGDINFPELGKLHVAGMTTEQLQQELTNQISKDVEDPMVIVDLVNFKVNVAGEVNNPGQIRVTRNRFSILDALSAAGDMTPYGERSNVLLIRENNGKKEYVHLDMNKSDVLDSPYYYLQQNDYIYVEPNKVRQANSKYNQDNAFKLSVISTVVSAASVIASLVIALTVK